MNDEQQPTRPPRDRPRVAEEAARLAETMIETRELVPAALRLLPRDLLVTVAGAAADELIHHGYKLEAHEAGVRLTPPQ